MRYLLPVVLLCVVSPTLSAKTILVSGSMTLDPKKTYTKTEFQIRQSDTILDCQGALIDGQNKVKTGLRIVSDGKTPLRNVTVKNCNFKNFSSSGIRIYWKGNDTLKLKHSMAERYRLAPQQIKLLNITVEDTAKSSVYVDDYVSDVLIDGLTVRRSGALGLYLEHHSRRTTVQNSLFEQNGYRGGKPAREGLAIDASMHNVIRNNTFKGNAQGGIFLYKNCGERFSTGKSVLRTQQASYNVIEGNTFIDMPRGVWLASRQSKNLSKWDCGDPSLDDGVHYQDYARHNTIRNNRFCGIPKPVIVEDNHNTITDNRYDRVQRGFAEVTRPPREKLLNQPVIGTVLKNNQADDRACQL
ncbi:MAG: right-handed parallel beta-helix repeat-containing protein [Pseudomonadota bacterium]|nr:right-handed parallel beta-helix repeat-containing protein [Pseudomonadota bacterium]